MASHREWFQASHYDRSADIFSVWFKCKSDDCSAQQIYFFCVLRPPEICSCNCGFRALASGHCSEGLQGHPHMFSLFSTFLLLHGIRIHANFSLKEEGDLVSTMKLFGIPHLLILKVSLQSTSRMQNEFGYCKGRTPITDFPFQMTLHYPCQLRIWISQREKAFYTHSLCKIPFSPHNTIPNLKQKY